MKIILGRFKANYRRLMSEYGWSETGRQEAERHAERMAWMEYHGKWHHGLLFLADRRIVKLRLMLFWMAIVGEAIEDTWRGRR